jgi:Na+-transporting methylmalonyl-CoA/oxaloacetate decarboxylase gamma subunit
MRIVFGVLSLLVVVAIIGVLAKKQLGAGVAPAAPGSVSSDGTVTVPTGTPKQQVDQFKNAAEAAVQQPRAMPDETK